MVNCKVYNHGTTWPSEKGHHIFSCWPRPKSQSPRKQKHGNLIPHTRQQPSVPSLYLSLSSLKQRNFKDISLYSILLYILQSKIGMLTHSEEILPSIHSASKAKTNQWKRPSEIMGKLVSKCLWLSMVPWAGGSWAPNCHSLTPLLFSSIDGLA